jgi:hypothetical protein
LGAALPRPKKRAPRSGGASPLYGDVSGMSARVRASAQGRRHGNSLGRCSARARAMRHASGGGPRERVRARMAASVGRVSRAWAHGAHGGSHLPRRVAGQRAEAGQAPASQPGQPASQPAIQPASQPANPPSIQPASQPNHWNYMAWGTVFSDAIHPGSQPSRQPASQPAIQPASQPAIQPNHCNSITGGDSFQRVPVTLRGCTFFLRKKRRCAASAFLGVNMGGFYLFWARLCRAQRKEPRAAAARVHYTAMFLGCPRECVRARRDAATGTVSGGVPRARAR